MAIPEYNRIFDTIWPGGIKRFWAGFAANGSPNEDTAELPDPSDRASFHEVGYFGTEAGPWRNPTGGPDIPAPNDLPGNNSWREFRRHPAVIAALGREACNQANCWKESNGGLSDQLAVGIASIRHGKFDGLQRGLDQSITVTSPNTPWGSMMSSMAWSTGTSRASSIANRVANAISFLPEDKRWDGLLVAYAALALAGQIQPAPANHRNPAYSIIRTQHKLASASRVYQDNGVDQILTKVATGSAPDPSVPLTVSPTEFTPGLSPQEVDRIVASVRLGMPVQTPVFAADDLDRGGAEGGKGDVEIPFFEPGEVLPWVAVAMAGVGGYLLWKALRRSSPEPVAAATVRNPGHDKKRLQGDPTRSSGLQRDHGRSARPLLRPRR